MGEIFERPMPDTSLGAMRAHEPDSDGSQVEFARLHRYFFARALCRDLDVLDITCGVGDGTALLAQVARSVVGVEPLRELVARAEGAYRAPGLRFVQGDVTSIPLPDASVDVVVSYDTIERFYEHDVFAAEVRRVLRPEGRLIVSCYQYGVHSPVAPVVNPLHVRELTHNEFKEFLSGYFRHSVLYAQRSLLGSALMPESPITGNRTLWTFERRDAMRYEASLGLPRPVVLVGVASELPVDDGFGVLSVETDRADELVSRIAELESEATGFASRIAEEREATDRAQMELAGRSVELETRVQDLERCRDQLYQRDEENRALAAAYQRLWSEHAALRLEHDATRARLTAVLNSASWRLSAPVAGIVGNSWSLLDYGKQLVASWWRARP